MSRLFGLTALLLLMVLLIKLPGALQAVTVPLSMHIGFLILAGYVLGKVGMTIGLPGITGYLLAGIIFGPSVLGLVDRPAVDELTMINNFALTLIALTAGGEVELGWVMKRFKSFGLITGIQCLTVFLGVALIMVFAEGLLPAIFPPDIKSKMAIACMFGVIAVAKSPSSTVAIIVESGSKGPVTDFTLGISIIKDVLVIVMFAVVLAISLQVLHVRDSGGDLVSTLLVEIVGSIAFGVALGYLIIFYLRRVGKEITITILAASFLIYETSHLLHLHALLVCMVAGIVVNNLSHQGRTFIEAIERGSLPVYVIFFAIAGAGLNFSVLALSWPLVLILVLSRTLFTWLGTVAGAVASKEIDTVRKYLWMGFTTQAGVTLGLAVLVERAFAESWGTQFKNVVIGSIAIFQIVGPVMFKYGLDKSGEIPANGGSRHGD